MILKSTSEIASELNISVRAVLERFRKRGIIAISKGSSSEGLIETFYIYESKINKTTFDF
jgi:DNA-binding transcriptional regulator LsrR (DeoR family)